MSQQRAVMLNNPASRKRRKEWIIQHDRQRVSLEDSEALATSETVEGAVIKRKRKPNRPKHEIEAEKVAKAARRQERESQSNR